MQRRSWALSRTMLFIPTVRPTRSTSCTATSKARGQRAATLLRTAPTAQLLVRALHFRRCHSFSHKNLKSPCVAQAAKGCTLRRRRSTQTVSTTLHLLLCLRLSSARLVCAALKRSRDRRHLHGTCRSARCGQLGEKHRRALVQASCSPDRSSCDSLYLYLSLSPSLSLSRARALTHTRARARGALTHFPSSHRALLHRAQQRGHQTLAQATLQRTSSRMCVRQEHSILPLVCTRDVQRYWVELPLDPAASATTDDFAAGVAAAAATHTRTHTHRARCFW